jgi:hypothetical protein
MAPASAGETSTDSKDSMETEVFQENSKQKVFGTTGELQTHGIQVESREPGDVTRRHRLKKPLDAAEGVERISTLGDP